MSWTIYKKNGQPREITLPESAHQTGVAGRFVHPELEYHGEWMGECFVTLNVRCAVPVDFEIGDYIIYRGEKFVINYNPTVVKKARRGTYGEGFTYDNVKFNSLSYELTDIRMLDYVLGDNDVHYSSLPKFSFFCNDVDDLADRLQVNADRYCNDNGITGGDRWLFVTPSQSRSLQRCGTDTGLRTKASAVYAEYFEDPAATSEEKVNQNVSVSNQTVWDTMKNIKDVFGLNFVVRGRVVVIGAAGLPTQDVFSYGKGNGLYEIERTADSEQQIITKLYAYGSDKNLPTRYYANLGMQCWTVCYLLDVDGVQLVTIPIPPTSAYFKNEVDVASLGGTKAFAVTVKVGIDGEEHQVYVRDTAGIENFPMENYSYVFGNDVPPLNIGDVLYFTKGIDKDKWPGSKEYPENIPNNMALNVLMLPGFGDMNGSLYQWVSTHGGTDCVNETGKATWRGHTAYFSKEANNPYILSENYLELGIREATKNFDGSDGDEIYPTITGTGHDTIVDAEVIKDDGAFADGDIPTFTITLPDFGSDFLLNELLQNDSAIEMTSGYCGGRSFTINDAKQQSNGTWLCTCQRDPDKDLDIYFPYAHKGIWSENQVLPYQLRGGANGDKYVLTGIEMTEAYVNAAAVNLLEAALVFLEQNDYTRYTFSPKVDELFMARQNDEAVASRGTDHEIRSYHDSIKEGDIMLFDDDDLDVDGSVFIDNLTIKEYGNGQIPTYEVTLRNDKQVGTIQRLQDQINSLSSGGGVAGVGGGGSSSVNIPQIRQLIQAYGKELFISKIAADVANGLITFLKGIQIGAEGAWGWVKEITVEGEQVVKAWFKNLYADYLEPTIMKVVDKVLGPFVVAGNLFVQKDDNNQGGNITVAGDINAPNGSVNAQDGNFTGSVTTKNLTVTGLAHFFELMIDKLRSSGGAFVFTPADGFSVEDVENTTFGGIVCKRLWWRASDGETETGNQWLVGDQAICMSFNLAKKNIGGVMTDVSNKMFWSVVCDKSTSEHLYPNGDTAMSHYITIYSGTGTEPTIPTDTGINEGKPLWRGEPSAVEIGDDIAMLGHRMQDATEQASEDMKARQSAVYITAYASYDTELTPPLMAFYKGVDDFDLSSHRGTYMDANGSRFVGRFVSSSTNQDIENLMNGSEIDIIYGNGNPNTVSTPHNAWNDAEKLRRVDKTLYFDLDLEPASEGGRLWKWTRNTTTGTGYIWVQINDVDSTAALDMISDVASDGVLTGGAEKTRVYLEWIDARKTTSSLMAQAEESGLYEEDSETYDGEHSYEDAYNGISAAFTALSTYLNNKVAFTIASSGYPAWINPNVAQGETESALKQSVILPVWTEKFPTLDTGAKVYRKVWDDYYNSVVELTRAINAWQYKTIEEMGDDGLIDAAEKATLRQLFNDTVIQFCKSYAESSLLENSITDQTVTGNLYQARIDFLNKLDDLGTYLNGTEPDGSDGAWNYSVKGYSWNITPSNISEFVDGLTDPESGLAPAYQPVNLFPLWLQKYDADGDEVETQSIVVKDDEWDYFWDRMTRCRATLLDAIRAAKQYQLEHVDVELAKKYETDNTNGSNPMPGDPEYASSTTHVTFKVGDSWYEKVRLKNPANGEWVDTNPSDGGYLYNIYTCYLGYTHGNASATYANRKYYWQLVSQATYATIDNDGSKIVQAVINSESYSALSLDVNGIKSEVGAIMNASPNLILNGDFKDGTAHFSNYQSSSWSVVDLVNPPSVVSSFKKALYITPSSTSSGIYLSTTLQPYMTLQSGQTYTLSFYAMSTGASKYIYVRRGNATNSNSNLISSTWARYTATFSGDGTAKAFYIYDAQSNTTPFYITGIQLERGSSQTTWQDFGGGLVNLQSQITQSANQISLSVKKDEARKAGIDIEYDSTTDSGTVTLDGDKIIVDGDLDVKGTITNSSKIIRYDDTFIRPHTETISGETVDIPASGYVAGTDSEEPYAYNLDRFQMIVPIDFDRTKSVSIKGMSGGNYDSNPPTKNCYPMAILPSYSSKTVVGYTSTYNAEITLPGHTISGTQVNITNTFHVYCRDWAKPLDQSSSSGIISMKKRWNCAMLVFSDPRLLQYGNYSPSFVTGMNSGTATEEGIKSIFCCNGFFSKVVAVMPGQTLSLISSVERYAEGGEYFLVWYVQNASEYTAIKGSIRLRTYETNSSTTTSTGTKYANFNDTDSRYTNLTLLAHPSLSCSVNTQPAADICINGDGTWPYRLPVAENGDTTWS